ncbi:MAG: hypothetical protein LLF82_001158 [Dehalococcoides mccartyi]|uniref:HgcAB-associated protein HgcC n=1 Tax=Dehalococcoides mccartyi TaxID=61435 RepID=UPI000805F8A3|nr:HgcAB-associated protein [Dehalococcoides mccartyi]MCF7635664.1 hypothetical protein [Dehalococcoides mccartyi]MDN4186473.1 HgcAB-associated protein [Dehalococcoides mccartyi]MEA2121072.1 hypothetical protein [Dehalococcoides mccartyi]MEA2122689.1 hypothetical protein [Dehalococcoides mccartyi]OBW60964.1 MAG: AbrB family transcriptional regulator [Dehalococcoides mccartyi]
MEEKCCCGVDAILSVDARGQLVLPKEIRTKLDIQPGDKLAAITRHSGGKPCCLLLIKADEFSELANEIVSPILKNMTVAGGN